MNTLGDYSCRDEGFCDCNCPNYDCIYHKIHNKERGSNNGTNN